MTILLRQIDGAEITVTTGEIQAAMSALNHDEFLVLCAILGAYSLGAQATINDVSCLARLGNGEKAEAVIERLIHKNYLKAERLTINDGRSVRPVTYIQPNMKQQQKITQPNKPSRMKFQEQAGGTSAEVHAVDGERKEKRDKKEKNNITHESGTSTCPASQDRSSCAATPVEAELTDAIGQTRKVNKMNHGWILQLESKDKHVKARAVKQIGGKYARTYRDVRQQLMPGSKQYFVQEKMLPKFAEIAMICLLNEINFAEYIRVSYKYLMGWKSRDVDFPTTSHLLSENFLSHFMDRGTHGQIETTKPNAFRTGLKNQSLPGALEAAGFSLGNDEIKFAESIARQRKVGMEVDCPGNLEVVVKWIMENGCPDL